MSTLVDTGVFYAHHDTDASRHETGSAALERILQSPDFGRAFTTDYVYDEVVTLTRRRTGRVGDAIEVGRRIRGDGYPDAIELVYASPALFEEAVSTFEASRDQALSFTDAMTIAAVEFHDIDAVLSFDDDFDGVVDRLDPADV